MSKYQGRVDPLQLLRSAFTENKKIRVKDKQLIFEKDVRVSMNQPTAWISPMSKKQYTIGSLWLFLDYNAGHITDYINKISQYGVDNVTISDREQILNYFLGKVNDSACINQEVKLQLANKTNNRNKDQQGNAGQDQGETVKKVKVDTLSPELQVIDFIYKFERPTSSKTRSLRCPNKSFQALLKVLQNAGGSEVKRQQKKLRINTIMQRKRTPIIIVPEHQQAGNLFLSNAQKFLANGEYIQNPPPLLQHQRKIEIQHTFNGRRVTFEVNNNPSLLTPSDWNNVVAIFVQGRKNQFQTWFFRDPVELFRKAKGFLLRFPTKEQNQGFEWNIKAFNLDRNVRYRDSQVQKAIWTDIQAFLNEKI